jgi:hypothetical protein
MAYVYYITWLLWLKFTMEKNVLNQNKSIIYDKIVIQSIWPRRLKTSSWCDNIGFNFLIFWNELLN